MRMLIQSQSSLVVAAACSSTATSTSSSASTVAVVRIGRRDCAGARRDHVEPTFDATCSRWAATRCAAAKAGTLDEMRATGWVAERAREAGLQPAGDDGTFFQWWPMRRTRLSENSNITVGGKTLRLWKDVVVSEQSDTSIINLPIVFVARQRGAGDDRRARQSGRDGAAVDHDAAAEQFTIRGNFQGAISADGSRARERRSRRPAAPRRFSSRMDRRILDAAFDATAAVSSRGTYAIDSAGAPAGQYARPRRRSRRPAVRNAPAQNAATGGGRGRGNAAAIPTLWLRHDMLETVKSPNARLTAIGVHRDVLLSVGQRDRRRARHGSEVWRTNTCCSADTRTTTARAIR